MARNGRCLCGAVRFSITSDDGYGACHCNMCRKFSGGIYFGMEVQPEDISFTGEDNLTIYKSSDWAERGFCSVCGSSVFYRVTAEGEMHGVYHVGAGLIDDLEGKLDHELFVDTKPEGYALSGHHTRLTAAQVAEMFGDDG